MKGLKGLKSSFEGLQMLRLLPALLLAPAAISTLAQSAPSIAGAQPSSSLAEYREVRWSPDGQSLAVVMRADPKAHFRIAIIPAEGGAPRWISPESEGALMPRWSPDGRWVAFVANVSTAPNMTVGLDVVSADGGASRRVVTASHLQLSMGYIWARDGRGFEYFVLFPEPERGHYIVDLEGHKTRTPNTESIGNMLGIEWSPDRSQIVFGDREPGAFVSVGKLRVPATRIYLADPHGGHARPLESTQPLPETPSWSPDGMTIVYSLFQRPANGPTLWSIRTDGTRNRSLAADGIRGQFSPDGQWIAYVDTRGTNTPSSPSGSSFYKRVCKVRPDGSGVVVLTR